MFPLGHAVSIQQLGCLINTKIKILVDFGLCWRNLLWGQLPPYPPQGPSLLTPVGKHRGKGVREVPKFLADGLITADFSFCGFFGESHHWGFLVQLSGSMERIPFSRPFPLHPSHGALPQPPTPQGSPPSGVKWHESGSCFSISANDDHDGASTWSVTSVASLYLVDTSIVTFYCEKELRELFQNKSIGLILQ